MKIVSISNHHQWDGVEMSEKAFWNLIEALKFSKWAFECVYEDEQGKTQTTSWGWN